MRKLKKTLAKRGAKGLAGLARRFKIMDEDHSGELDVVEFKNAMRETKAGITDDEAEALLVALTTIRAVVSHITSFYRLLEESSASEERK